jgi:hypothetical protein
MFLALTALGVSLSLYIGGCVSSPELITSKVTPNGKPYTLVVGATNVPSGCSDYRNGCYDIVANTVYLPIFYRPDTLEHEEAHVDGMRHSAWERNCAVVTIPAGKYIAGDVICVDKRGETVLQSIPTR